MILKKQQLKEAGTLFSQQNSLDTPISPAMVYQWPNAQSPYYIVILAANATATAIISPSKTVNYNAANKGITWSNFSILTRVKKMVPVANNDIFILINTIGSNYYPLAKTTENYLENSIINNRALTSNSFSSLTVSVTTKNSNFFGQVTYSTADRTYSTSDLRDIDGTTDGTVVCVGTFGLVYSLDNGSTWNKAANNISDLSITRVFIGIVSTTKYYIALTNDGKICFTSSLRLTENGDDKWDIQTVSGLSSATINNICQIDNAVFICTSIGLYYRDLTLPFSFRVINDKACYSIVKNNNGKYILSTADGILHSDNLSDWVEGDNITNSLLSKVIVNDKERIIAIKNNYSYYSEDKYVPVPFDASKPLTGAQAKVLVQQCKAYVQSLKNES